MGTRHLICVVNNGEYKVAQYGQWDGQPSGQGVDILDFLRNDMDRSKFENQIDTLSFATEEELKQMWIESGLAPNEKLVNMEVSNKHKELYPEDSRDTSSKILQLIQESNRQLKLNNSLSFANNSLSCEWAYVIDLDKNTFEVYKGFNQDPLEENERFYFLQENLKPVTVLDSVYYPVKLIVGFDLDKLPTEKEFLFRFKG